MSNKFAQLTTLAVTECRMDNGDLQAEILDLDVLRSLDGGQSGEMPDLIVELIDLYLNEAAVRIAAMRRAIDSNDEDGWKQAAHALRGSSSTLGARGIGRRCDELEQVGFSDVTTARSIFERLLIDCTQVRSAMLQERQRRIQAAGS